MVDHLGSQGFLAFDRARGLLYAVNAGSNTVTVFSPNGDRLIHRQVIGSGGTFPVSVAVTATWSTRSMPVTGARSRASSGSATR